MCGRAEVGWALRRTHALQTPYRSTTAPSHSPSHTNPHAPNQPNPTPPRLQAAKRAGASALPASLRLAATLPGENKKVGKGTDKSMRRKELKEDVSGGRRGAGGKGWLRGPCEVGVCQAQGKRVREDGTCDTRWQWREQGHTWAHTHTHGTPAP